MRTTGDVEGVNGVIYIQNSGSTGDSILNPIQDGLMRSLDSGQTWVGVRGPRQGDGSIYPITTTRFSVTGCGDIVYASDGAGGLWKTVDGGDSTNVIPQCVILDTDRVRLASSVICDTGRYLYYLHNINKPGGIILESIGIFDTLGRPDTTGSVFIDSFPTPYTAIRKGDSVAFGLGWHPGSEMDSTGSDSVTIRVIVMSSYFDPAWGLDPYDTFYVRVGLKGISQPADFTVVPKTVTKDTIPVCNSVDTTIELINNGCDYLTITQAQLAKNNWTLTDAAGNALKLPILVSPYGKPGDTLRLRVHATPTSSTLLSDSLEVKMHYEGHDTTFGVGLHTSAKQNPLRPWLTTADSLNFGSLATCDSTESSFTLKNTGCDTLTITKDDLADSHFELLDLNGKLLKLPLTIPTDSSQNVLIRYVPNSLTTNATGLKLHYHYDAFDSTNVVVLTGTGAASGGISFPPDPVDFHTVSICSFGVDSLTIHNSSCGQTAFIDSVVLPPPFIFTDSLAFSGGKTINPDSSITLHFRYTPTKKGTESGKATFFYALVGTGTKGDTSFTLTGIGGSGNSVFETKPALSSNFFAFPTISQCDQPGSVSFTIYNSGCDVMTVTGLTLDPSLTGALGVSEDKTLPATLPPPPLGSGDSLHVTVKIVNLNTGTYTGNFHIQFTSADGSTHDSVFTVSATITAGSGKSTLTMTTPKIFNVGSINSCSTDTTIIRLNYQGCGTAGVGYTITGTGFTLVGSGDSLHINPGYTDSILVAYDGSSGNLNSTITITSKSPTMDTTVQLSGTEQPAETVHFKLGLSAASLVAGQTFTASLTPDISFSGKGLNTVHGVFEYRSNNFEVASGSLLGANISGQNGPTRVGSMEQYSFDVTGNNLTLDSSAPLVSLPMEAMVSDSVGGTIAVNSIALNGGDVQFNNCVLTSTTQGSNASLNIQCGDSVLINVLEGKPIVLSEDPRPNPVTEESGFQTTLNLVVAESGVADIILYDALGEEISRDHVSLASGGTIPYTFHLADLPGGSYYFAVRFTSTSAMSGTLRGTFLLLK